MKKNRILFLLSNLTIIPSFFVSCVNAKNNAKHEVIPATKINPNTIIPNKKVIPATKINVDTVIKNKKVIPATKINNNAIKKLKYYKLVNPKTFSVDSNQQYGNNFNYGDVPLREVRDEFITSDDIVQMIDYIVWSKLSVNYNFGDRNIDTNIVANGYSKWLINNWRDYPLYSLSAGALDFTLKSGSNFVGIIHNPVYSNEWEYSNDLHNSFIEFITNGLINLDSSMTDVDRAFFLWRYVAEWFDYSYDYSTKTLPRAVNDHKAVCSLYSTAYTLLLNLAGVKAIPMLTGNDGGESELHQVTWVNLDLNNDGNFKWYLSDATWGRVNGSKLNSKFLSYLDPTIMNLSEFLKPVSLDPDTANIKTQYFNKRFWWLKWDDFFLDKSKIAYGKNLEELINKKIMTTRYSRERDKRSRSVFYNGYWYTLVKTKNQRKTIYKLMKQKINEYDGEEVDLKQLIGEENYNGIESSFKDFYPHLFSYKNNLIFLKNDYRFANKTFFIYNMKTNKSINIAIPSDGIDNEMNTYYVFNNQIYYQLKNSELKVLNLTEEQREFIFGENNYDISDLENQLLISKTILSSILIGHEFGNITSEEKLLIDKKIAEFENFIKNNTSLTHKQILNKINEIKEFEINIYDLVNKKPSSTIANKTMDDIYFVNSENIEKYGFNFDGFLAMKKLSSTTNLGLGLRYNVYYGKTKNSVTNLILNNVTKSNLFIKDKNLLKNGFYYIEAFLPSKSSEIYQSKIFEVKYSNNNFESPYVNSLLYKFYNSNFNSLNDNVVLSTTINNWNSDLFNVNAKLIYYNPFTKIKTVLKEINNIKSYYKLNYNIGQINNSNTGLYYVELDVNKTNIDLSYKVYSTFYWAFTKDNNSDNFSEWSEAIKFINQN